MKKYFGKYASSGDVQTALDKFELSKPYVATITGEGLDFNTKNVDYTNIFGLEFLEDGNFTITNGQNFYFKINGGTEQRAGASTTITVKKGDILTGHGVYAGIGLFKDNTIKFRAFGNIRKVYEFNGGNQSYKEMFKNCTGLVDIDNLYFSPNIQVHISTFQSMFYNCKGLTSVPSNLLPYTTCASGGYNAFNEMFAYCSNLENGPDILISEPNAMTFNGMFSYCGKLKYIKCLSTDLSASNCFSIWLNNVSATGTFVKAAGVEWPSGISGIPNGWTVIEE